MKKTVNFATDFTVEEVVMALNNLVDAKRSKVARVFLCHAPANLIHKIAKGLAIEFSKSDPLVDLVIAIMESEDDERKYDENRPRTDA